VGQVRMRTENYRKPEIEGSGAMKYINEQTERQAWAKKI
jgi:hypothetical protein